MLCLIRLFVCSVRLDRSLRPASFPILHARRRRLQSFRQFTTHWLPNYGPTYYAAFVHDPEGNNIEAMLV
jgi:hypothetical protein